MQPRKCVSSLVVVVVGLFTAGELEGQEIPPSTIQSPGWIAPRQFTEVRSIRELDGGVLVADEAEDQIVFLHWNDKTGAPVGRVGHGPGEYREVGPLYPLAGDSTLFIDSFHGRWNLLVGAEIRATRAEHRAFNRLFRRRFSGADTLGNVLARPDYVRRSDVPLSSADSVLLLFGDRATRDIDTLAYLKGPGSGGATILPPQNGGLRTIVGNNPLAAGEPALLLPDGWIAVARQDPYRVDWRTPSGQWIEGGPLPFAPRQVSRAEKCAAIERMLRSGRPCQPDSLPGWPETVPPFVESTGDPVLYAAPGGNVVIKRTPVPNRPGTRYDVVDRDGRLVRSIHLPQGVMVVGFGDRSVYTVRTNELDLQTLRRHPWPR